MASYSPQYYASAVPIPSKESSYGYYSHPSPHSDSGSGYSASPPPSDEERAASATTYGNHQSHSHSHYNHNNYASGNSSSNGASYATSTTGDYGVGGGVGVGGYYAGSQAESASALDFNDYMQGRFDESFDPIPLDRSLATQAQTSGKLNNKHRELLEIQAQAQARLAKTRARFAKGLQDARDVNADLEWTSKRVS
ncbi:hypothetical protein F5B20DRAFT_223508 [Whalleya microplaca]|nr:hypothetical protein F5B20DRAFT_223508 [Whalleya microplaca]